MIVYILLLPFLGFIACTFFGRFLGKGVTIITTGNVGLAFLIVLNIFISLIRKQEVFIINLLEWLSINSMEIYWGIWIDSLTIVMLLIVLFISFLVHLYSIEYMAEDPHLVRFMGYLSLFTFFMLILITASNFLQMFVGWEGVGLSSYLLISFWYTRIQASKSAIKAMLVNRVGDFFILLGLLLIYFIYETLDYSIVFCLVPYFIDYEIYISVFKFSIIDVICLLLLLGAMGKSAQIGLHTWLPDAMEGPTPVSALIHAATMVTAGIFLISRCSFIFEYSQTILNLVAIIGSLTAFFAASTGLFQNDIKKIIAYSTCSQLGYMLFSCGLSGYNLAIFHLYNHAFFKALLFLGAGAIIHSVMDEQDIRRMGGFSKVLPYTYICFLIGSLALIGFPFFSGFYSKDPIIELAFITQTNVSLFCFFLGTVGAFLTAFYSSRLIFLVFLGKTNATKFIIKNIHENGKFINTALFFLVCLSITSGFFSVDAFIGGGTFFWQHSLNFCNNYYFLHDIEFIDIEYKVLPLCFMLLGSILSFLLYKFNYSFYIFIKTNKIINKIKNYNFIKFLIKVYKKSSKIIYFFLLKKWYFDKIYNTVLNVNVLKFGLKDSYINIDRGILEYWGPLGLSNIVNRMSNTIFKSQENRIDIFFNLLLVFYGFLIILYLLFIYNFSLFFLTCFFLLLLLINQFDFSN